MMRVIVEVHPGGDASRKKQIASIDIANMSELAPVSRYEARCEGEGYRFMTSLSHIRSHGWMPLVRMVLQDWFDATQRQGPDQ